MPFTVSHAAAAVPLKRLLGRFGVPSALVIGCWVPDLPYFLPLGINRHWSHSVVGLLAFCIPAGLLWFWLFHRYLKVPLLHLLPRTVQARIGSYVANNRPTNMTTALAVLLSVSLGAASHLCWDAFTHGDGAGVRLVAPLQRVAFVFRGHTLYGFSLLQHASTIFGLVYLVWWLQKSLPSANNSPSVDSAGFSAGHKGRAAAALLIASPLIVFALEYRYALFADHGPGLNMAIGASVIAALRAVGVSVLAYCALWHAERTCKR